jgi:NAD(P)H-hydrate epimerase
LLPVLTPPQSSAWDTAAIAVGLPITTLMENAGRAVAQVILERWAAAATHGVLVACGGGNNGGDGWVTARTLHGLGLSVWVTEVSAPAAGPAADARASALRDGVRLVPVDGPWPGVGLLVDAILGSGASGAPRPPAMQLCQRVADLHKPIVAIDGPTGLDLANGVQHGPIIASTTVTFGGVKRGHLLARDEIGDLLVADIGLPNPDPSWPTLVSSRWAAQRVTPFAANAYKGTRGHVVIVGGSPAMVGAARLAARAAFAAGAGLVHVIAPQQSIDVLRTAEPDVQTHVHALTGELDADTSALIERANVVAIGPGLGREAGRAEFVLRVLDLARAAVVDADALTVLKSRRSALSRVASTRSIVCTPHVGEFRTLFGEFAMDLETAPWEAATAAACGTGVTVLLKGVPTVVAAPSGGAFTVAAGNPGLGTGGSGDLLTGIIATLMAQGVEATEAAAAGAQAHGEAADFAARRVTARGMRPMDVVAGLHDVWRAWHRPASAVRFPWLAELPVPRAV